MVLIGCGNIKLHAEWVASLKEKRMVIRSLTERARNKFNIAISETGSNDLLQIIEIGFVCISNDYVQVENILKTVLGFIENNTDAVVYDIETEILRPTFN